MLVFIEIHNGSHIPAYRSCLLLGDIPQNFHKIYNASSLTDLAGSPSVLHLTGEFSKQVAIPYGVNFFSTTRNVDRTPLVTSPMTNTSLIDWLITSQPYDVRL